MAKDDEEATKTSAQDPKAGNGKSQATGGASGAGSSGAGAASSAGATNPGQGGASSGSGAKAGGEAASEGARISTAKGASAGAAQNDAIAMLKADHRKVEGLFDQVEKAGVEQKADLIEQICQELIIHAELEEKIFYPAARQPSTDDQLDEAQVEHDAAKLLILELLDGDDADEFRDAKVKVLGEQIRTHIKEEEAPDGVLAKAQKAGINTRELAERLTMLKQRLQQQAQSDRLPQPRPVSFQQLSMAQENRMPRQSNDRDRDEYGRFTSDDDDRRGSYSSRGGRDYDDDRGSRGRGHERDEEGRFTSGHGGGRDYDDDRGGRGGGGRGQGGWFGDPQGHSEASRRGSEERDNGGRSYRSEERSYRSRDDDDYDRGGRGGGRGQGGWFGDSEGHSEAARRGWEERGGGGRSYSRGRDDDDDDRGGRGRGGGRERDDEGRFTSGRGGGRDYDDDDRGGRGGRGQGGWFGDPEGHAEAARRGWDERDGGGSRSRGRDDDDDRGGRGGGRGGGRERDDEGRFTSGRGGSRGRDDDDDRGGRGRGGSGGRGQGGWFGDSEGHAEAARRGWEDRR